MILVYDNNISVGCASFKRYGDDCAEVKRVFVKFQYRGKGVGIKLMELLEKSAREQGYQYMILETGELLAEAMTLYRKTGYKFIPNYG